MSDKTKDQGACPAKTVLDLATSTATHELGTEGGNKKVSATATLATSVTENGKVTKNGTNATVSLGVTSSEEDEAPAGCCDKCGTADCCSKAAKKA